MAKRPKKTTPSEAESERLKHRDQLVAQVFIHVVRWFGVILLAYFSYRSIAALAGKTTLTEITADLHVKDIALIVVAVAGLIYGGRQRSLRKYTVERLQQRIRGLEVRLDPARTSSGLTERGDTHPSDLP